MLPTQLHLHDDLYRVYFSGRDRDNQSYIGYVDIDLAKPTEIVGMSEKPVLSPGLLGTFDDSGVSPLCAFPTPIGEVRLYYMGWQRGSTTRASEMTGLAMVGLDDVGLQRQTFVRYSQAPILERTNEEPYCIGVLSCVVREGDLWRGWYDSCDRWITAKLPKYNIKYMESDDGIHWRRRARAVSLTYRNEDETRISRASVIRQNGIYRMWYCYAIGEGGYRMGYGESEDGIGFNRKDGEAGIDPSSEGWDSEMVCYPSVFEHKGQLWMLYCGNGYGRTGFGIAMEE